MVFVAMLMLGSQRRTLFHNREYALAQYRLRTQIEHYGKLYESQHEVRSIRHELGNNLIAISGMLEKGLTGEAIDRIRSIRADVGRTAIIVDTGLPSVDAVISAKMGTSAAHGIIIQYKVIIENGLHMDQFDLAAVVANALDNAIEGILRSETCVEAYRRILLHISSVSEYISILVENHVSAPVNKNFETTKPDKQNHGFGLAQIRSIAKKYSGDVQPEYDPSICRFSLNVLLKNRSLK